jgi:hypothetical protein
MWVFLFFQIVFGVIFYNHEGHSCSYGPDNNVRLTLLVKPKIIGLDVFTRSKSLGSGLFSRPNYLGFSVVIKPRVFGSGLVLLKRKKILF